MASEKPPPFSEGSLSDRSDIIGAVHALRLSVKSANAHFHERQESRYRVGAEIPEILEVWLFGSFARGTQGPKSDIDLAVAFAGETAGERDVFHIEADCNEPSLSRRVHLHTVDSDSAKSGVKSDGICLFNRHQIHG